MKTIIQIEGYFKEAKIELIKYNKRRCFGNVFHS